MKRKLKGWVFGLILYSQVLVKRLKQEHPIMDFESLGLSDEVLDTLILYIFSSKLFICPTDFLRNNVGMQQFYLKDLLKDLETGFGVGDDKGKALIILLDGVRQRAQQGEVFSSATINKGLEAMRRQRYSNNLTSLQERVLIVRRELDYFELGTREELYYSSLREIEKLGSMQGVNVPLAILDLLAFAPLPHLFHNRARSLANSAKLQYNRSCPMLH